MKWVYDNKGNMVCGDYVMTDVKNSFNDKKSYWISKKDCTIAFYCFSYISDEDFFKQMDNPQIWINYFENRMERLYENRKN